MELLIGTNKGFSLDFKLYIVKVTVSIFIGICNRYQFSKKYIWYVLDSWLIGLIYNKHEKKKFFWEVRQSPNTSETNKEGVLF